MEASKLSIKNLFSHLLLKKYKHNREIEFAPVYFNSFTKTVINHRFKLEIFFQEILYIINNWINNGCGWNVESIESQYIKISTYGPLTGGSYMDLPAELRSPRKGLINIKNRDKKCFLWCQRILKIDQQIVKQLNYDRIDIPVQEKDFNRIEMMNNICINVFGYENKLFFPIYVSDQSFKDSMDLLLFKNDDNSHYVCIKDFDKFTFHKTKNKNKNWFCKSCLQCFSRKSMLIKHKKNCLSINGKQSVKLEKGIIEFKNFFKQIPVPFKIYDDFEYNLRGVESYEDSYTKKYQGHIPSSFSSYSVKKV